MEPKTKGYLFASSSLAIIIIIFGYLNLANQVNTAPNGLGECNPINYSPQREFNIVFIGEDEEKAKEYSGFLFTTSPYSEYADRINTLYVNAAPACEQFKNIATYCYNQDTISLAAVCDPDIIIAFKEEDSSSIRASAKDQIISLNTKITQLSVITHELGHAIRRLLEEYISIQGNSLRSKEPNCKKEASDFDSIYNIGNDWVGCTTQDLLRSTENGVMRTLSSNDYGEYNIDLIREVFDKTAVSASPLTGRAIEISEKCAEEQFILFDVKENSLKVLPGCHINNIDNEDSQSKYQIIQDGSTIEENSLSLLLFTDTQESDQSIISGQTFQDNNLLITLPYPPQGDLIRVYDEEGTIIIESNLNQAGALACVL